MRARREEEGDIVRRIIDDKQRHPHHNSAHPEGLRRQGLRSALHLLDIARTIMPSSARLDLDPWRAQRGSREVLLGTLKAPQGDS